MMLVDMFHKDNTVLQHFNPPIMIIIIIIKNVMSDGDGNTVAMKK